MNGNIYINFSAETSENDTWVKEFFNTLTVTLDKISHTPVRIISGLQKNVDIEKLIDEANILVFVFNGFISDDFSKDLKIFELHQGEYISGGKEIFIVNKSAKFSSIIPGYLKGFNYYNFFETNIRTNETIEYTPLLQGDRELKFWSKLTDLAYDIKILTDTLSSNKDNSSKLTVYLAEVSKDQMSNREILKREFLLSDFRVLPGKPLVSAYSEFQLSVSGLIQMSDFSIHIMGEIYGDSPSESDYSFPEIQNKVVTELWKGHNLKETFYRFVWLPPNLEPYDDKQVQYLKRLRRELTDNNYGEIIQCSIEEFKEVVFKKIGQLEGNNQKKRIADPNGTIVLITDNASKSNYKKIENQIKSVGRYYETIDLSDAGDLLPLNIFKQKLQMASAAIIFNVNGNATWMEGIVGLTIKNFTGGEVPGKRRIAAISSAKSNMVLDFESLHVDFISIDDGLLDHKVEKFLTKIN